MDGLESIARGLVESHVEVVTGYPGGPATPILENVSCEDVAHIEWSVNEKQAVALAGGASMVGARAAVIMKHVGINVASDAIMGMALNGTQGGLVFFAGDDPGGRVSQNEQDTRNYAELFGMPMIEPSSVPEAKQMTKKAFMLSERYEIPVMIRFINTLGELEGEVDNSVTETVERKIGFDAYTRDQFLIGDVAEKHRQLHKKIQAMSATLEELSFDNVIAGAPPKQRKGVITSGPVSNYVKTVVNEKEATLPVFKIGTLYPFPRVKLNNFLEGLDEVLVVEEVDPWIEKRVAMVSSTEQQVRGKLSGDISREGPINREDVRNAIERLIGIREHHPQWVKRSAAKSPKWKEIENCPMKAFHGTLKNAIDSLDEKVIVLGDTGCGYQGAKHPYETIDSFLCMGVSVSMAAGATIAGFQGKTVAVMGDSSFLHSGIQSLMNAVYHDADVTFLIFDNRKTGETGRQPNPGTGESLQNEEIRRVAIEKIVKDCNVNACEVVDSINDTEVVPILTSYVKKEGVNVIILREPCPENCGL